VSLLSASAEMTARLEVPADPLTLAAITSAIATEGGLVTAFDVVESTPTSLIVDLTYRGRDAAHGQTIAQALGAVSGVRVRKVSDRTFLLHLGGKIQVTPRVPLKTRDDLSMAYTPGVARICEALAARPQDAHRLTIKRNTVAIVTDGSAVLGLGNLGPTAALPVMEGKAALFKRFADVDAWPVCLDTQDSDEIVRTVELLAPVYGGINLEDIAAPRCFEIERRLSELLDIPVFHDDQHGTAIVVLAALLNALRLVGKALEGVRVVLVGAGAAGTAIADLLAREGVGDLVVCDLPGVLHEGDPGLDPEQRRLAAMTRPPAGMRTLRQALFGADVVIGVSVAGAIGVDDVAGMARDAIVFALANPEPEIDPAVAQAHAAVVATGRSDYPNQINNVLVFPGVFRGLLDSRSKRFGAELESAAGHALARAVADEELNPAYVIPSVFDPRVSRAVAGAVATAATDRGFTG
jgi:malate dehydrogenase (oxaloacetate-decarboxylating)